MKILFVLENFYPHIGGVETLFNSLAHKLSDQNHEVVVLTTLKNKQDLTFESIGNVQIHRKNYRNRYFFTIFAFFAAFKLSKNCDLIHTTSYNAALPAWLAGKMRAKKVIITFHEAWGGLWFKLPFMSKVGARLHYLFERMLLKLNFHKFIAVSNFTKEALIQQGVSAEKVKMIYNGIDYEEFTTDKHLGNQDNFRFTFFGRLGLSKGIEIYLEAISRMQTLDQDICYQLIIPKQPKPFLDEINKLIGHYGIRDILTIQHSLPFVKLKNEIAASSAVVIPSHSEGFCFAAVETMAIGTPIISSGRGALNEVIAGKYIQLNKLNATELTNAMQRALNNEWEEKAPKQFPISDTIDNYLSLYMSTLR